jgi:polyisoprenoid-binding protein YceI
MNFKTLMVSAVLAVAASSASAQTYNIDPGHTYPSFEADHLGISFWRGKFTKTSGKVVLDRAAKTGSIDIVIDASTIDFGHAKMNDHARGKDMLNVEKYPTVTYKSTALKFDGDKLTGVEGEMTMMGVTKPLALKVRAAALPSCPWPGTDRPRPWPCPAGCAAGRPGGR